MKRELTLVALARAVATAVLFGAACAAGFAVTACGSSLRRAPVGGRVWSASDYLEVPYPPPPARVEVVPHAPGQGAVWVDGDWSWHANRWVWGAGGWVEPVAGTHLSLSVTVRASDGRLFFVPSGWFDANGRLVATPRVLVPAASVLSPATEPGGPDAGA